VTTEAVPPMSRVQALRESFDSAFVDAPANGRAETTGLLAVRIGATPAALRLADISGLFADKVITALPQSPPELLGLAGFRGTVIPVYDLGILLGTAGSARPRWCVVAAGGPPVALAFHQFDGYLQVPAHAITRAATGDARPERRDVVTVDGQPRSIVEVRALVDAIAVRTR
jgi:chemotaxis signal transduction protein